MLDNHSLSKMPNIDVKSPEIQTELGAHYDDIPEEMLDLATDPETLQSKLQFVKKLMSSKLKNNNSFQNMSTQ